MPRSFTSNGANQQLTLAAQRKQNAPYIYQRKLR
jgi:hypothetical protein